MKKELIGFLICTLLITVAILPAAGTITNVNSKLEKDEQQTVVEETSATNANGDDVDWWPMFQHDPQNTGYTTSKGPNTDNILWTFQGRNGHFRGSTVVNGKVYVGTPGIWSWLFTYHHAKFYCLDAETGNLMWMYSPNPRYQIWGIPAVVNGKVYVCSGHWDKEIGDIYCLDADDGSLVWEYRDIGLVPMGPIVVDGKLYAGYIEQGSERCWICCLNADTGDELWKHKICDDMDEPRVYPAVANGKVYYGFKRTVICLNATTGETIWNWKNDDGYFHSSPTVVEDKVYFGTNGHGIFTPEGQKWIPGRVYCFNATSGEKIWETEEIRGSFYSSPAVAFGNLYIGTGYPGRVGDLYCLNATDGSFIWKYRFYNASGFWIPSGINEVSITVDGKVYVGSAKIYCFNASTGDIIWTYKKEDKGVVPTPAIADDRLFVGFGYENKRDAVFICFSDISSDAPNAPTVSGLTNGSAGEEYEYTITTNDPNGDDVYYYINWDDGSVDEWMGPYSSGESVAMNHTWSKKGKYEIRVRAKDTDGLRGAIGTLAVTMPKNHPSSNQQSNSQQSSNPFFFQILQRLLNIR